MLWNYLGKQLIDKHSGEVPKTKKELLELQGIGLKCANLLMNFNFGDNVIGVDSHLHRVLNRLGIVNTITHTQTTNEINDVTPNEYKKHAHEWIIQHGMEVCKSQKPNCKSCILEKYCTYEKKSL